MPAEWPKEVWLNRFDDLPLEWWANPSTTSDPEDIVGKPLTARRYVPESSDLVRLSEVRERLTGNVAHTAIVRGLTACGNDKAWRRMSADEMAGIALATARELLGASTEEEIDR